MLASCRHVILYLRICRIAIPAYAVQCLLYNASAHLGGILLVDSRLVRNIDLTHRKNSETFSNIMRCPLPKARISELAISFFCENNNKNHTTL
jgi:hypothetical protein